MSAPYKLTEGATQLIMDCVRANIAAALDVVSAQAGLPKVSTENPRSYFIWAKPQGYQLPAIFVISDDLDFKIEERKANCINGQSRFTVSVLVEDQNEDDITYKAWRYQSALHYVLDGTKIVSTDGSLAIKIVVYHHRFSPVFSQDGVPGGQFRKEVVLMCNVEHIESF